MNLFSIVQIVITHIVTNILIVIIVHNCISDKINVIRYSIINAMFKRLLLLSSSGKCKMVPYIEILTGARNPSGIMLLEQTIVCSIPTLLPS